MTRKMQTPTRVPFDLTEVSGGLVTTAEFKMFDDDVVGYWWTSGLNSAGQLGLLGEHQLVWASAGVAPEMSARSIYADHVLPLARKASEVMHLLALTPVYDPAFRSALLTEHLEIHRQIGTYSDEEDGVVGSIAKQYQLAESFIAATTIEFLAAWNELPVSTIRKRLERAREAGMVTRRLSPVERRR